MSGELPSQPLPKSVKYPLILQSLFLLLFVTLLPLIISSVVLIRINQRFLEDDLLERQNRIASSIATELDHFAERAQTNLSLIADTLSPQWLSSEKKGEFLRHYLVEHPHDFTQLYIQEGNIVLTASTEGATPDLASTNSKAYQQALKGLSTINCPYLSPSQDDLLMNFAIPIVNENKAIEAVLVGEVPVLSTLTEVIRSTNNLSGTNSISSTSGKEIICVLDSQGRLVAHPDRKRALLQEDMTSLEIVHDYFLKNIPAIGMISFTTKDSTDMIGSIAKVRNLGWGVLVQAPQAEAYSKITAMKKITLRWSLFGSALAIFIGILFARHISRPIRAFVESALKIAKGDFSQRIQISNSNEIGQLVDTFNYMTERLQAYDREMRELYVNTIRALVAAIDAKDPYTRGHSERVAYYSREIGREMALSEGELETLYIGALLHDIGKIGIHDQILKGGELSKDDYMLIQAHPSMGTEIMLPIKQLHGILPIIKYHHERFDGRGYPEHLVGNQIPLMAVIVGIADTYDAMITDRPYQKKVSADYVIKRMREWAGSRYDPKVIAAFIRTYGEGRLKFDPQLAAKESHSFNKNYFDSHLFPSK